MVSLDIARRLIDEAPVHCELILTGRDPGEEFIAAAHYVSRIDEVKHPYSQGIEARRGIEF